MRPIDFVVFDGDSSPNVEAYKVSEAMMKPIKILASDGEYVVLSYYLSNGHMTMDIQKKDATVRNDS